MEVVKFLAWALVRLYKWLAQRDDHHGHSYGGRKSQEGDQVKHVRNSRLPAGLLALLTSKESPVLVKDSIAQERRSEDRFGVIAEESGRHYKLPMQGHFHLCSKCLCYNGTR